MKTATITRIPDDKQTVGALSVDDGDFSCHSLELKWLNNQNLVSCIPTGEYTCKYTRSTRLSELHGGDYYTYEILNVPGRGGVRIHSGNFGYKADGKPDSKGCPLLGSDYKDINGDGVLDIVNSKNTVKAFEEFMEYKDFKLIIRNIHDNTK